MMEQKEWLWKQKSSEKSHFETESSDPESSHSEKYSDEQEALKESPMGTNQSPDVTSNAMAGAEAVNNSSFINAQSPEYTSKLVQTRDNINDCVSEEGENGEKGNVKNVNEGDVNVGLRTTSEKPSAALVNVSAKEDLVKQHAKVAEEAIAGWEKAENEVASLKKQFEALTLRNSTLEDQVTHLDGALKECVRQLRQTREEQEQNIHDAVVKKTLDLESSKIKLENQFIELQNKLEASNARSPSSVDLDMCQKVEYLEKENMALKRELQAQAEELEIMTIERDLSTQAAETASKQHLDSIKKVARLEAECRRLKNMASRASLVNDHKSSIDSQSDSGDRLNAVVIDTCKMSGPELDKSEPGCSESWASALIAELDQFKTEKCRTICCSSVKIDLMDDFLEMERLAALPDTKNEGLIQDSVVADQCINEESSLRDEFDKTNQQMDEVKEKLEKVEAEKAELQIALMKNEECIEASQLRLREAEMKLEELQRELENAYKSKQMMENKLMSMEAEAQTITAKVHLLEAEVDKERAISDEMASKCKKLEEELESKEQEVDNERAISDEIASKYKELEEELESKKQEEKLRSIASSCVEMKIKQEDLAVAAGKLAECQKTIASLGNQLKSLATLEDFLIDTASIPEFSANPSLIARADGELWKLHSNDTYSPKRDSSSSSRLADGSCGAPLNKSEESSPPSSSSSSTTLPNNVSSDKSRNGFAKFFSQTKNGLRLEI